MRSGLVSVLSRSTLLRYLLIGGTGFLFEVLILLLATSILGLGDAIAVSLSYWLGLFFSFFLQKFFAFGSRDLRLRVMGAQGLLYAALVLMNYAVTLVFVSLTAGALGVVLARAVALIITTLWNYVIYKMVIFNSRFTSDDSAFGRLAARSLDRLRHSRLIWLFTLLTVTLVTCLAIMSISANMVADDYAYFASIEAKATPFHYVVDHYLTHNGRLSQAALVALGYTMFGETAVRVMPFLLLAALALALAWLANLVLSRFDCRGPISLLLGFSLSAITILSVPSPFDSYLWLTSSTVYLGSLIALCINTCLAILFSRAERTRLHLLIPALILMALSQSFSEPTALCTIAAAGLWMCIELITRNWRRARLSGYMLLALILGFLMVYLAPGTAARQEEVNAPLGIRHILVRSFDYFPTLFNGLQWWGLLLIVIVAYITALNLGTVTRLRRFVWSTLAIASVLFVGSSYFVFTASNFGSSDFPLRGFTLPSFGLVLSLYLVALTGCKCLLAIGADRPVRASVTALALLCSIAALPFALHFAAAQIQALGLRDSLMAIRDLRLSEQISAGTNPVVVGAAPVLVHSEAFDIENPGQLQAEWFVEGFRAWHQLEPNIELVMEHTPPSYCLPKPEVAKPQFLCQ